jgi:hypothetical protein
VLIGRDDPFNALLTISFSTETAGVLWGIQINFMLITALPCGRIGVDLLKKSGFGTTG